MRTMRFLRLFAVLAALSSLPACYHGTPDWPTDPTAPGQRSGPVRAASMGRIRAHVLSLTITDTSAHVSDVTPIDGFNSVGLQLITSSTLAGAWKIEVANETTAAYSDITSGFSPTIAAVTTASNQYVQLAPISAYLLRATFTGTSGSGVADVWLAGK